MISLLDHKKLMTGAKLRDRSFITSQGGGGFDRGGGVCFLTLVTLGGG